MNDDEVRRAIAQVLHEVAPEVELDGVGGGVDLREALGLDSMDILNFAIGLQERTGVDVPERDYPEIVTLDGCARYLLAHLPV
ncbi:MAG TPA: acyl carrier protein [Acidimicrobiia bacterium]|nr:acyl carrier protein [Acidimicrobiia bacterium]